MLSTDTQKPFTENQLRILDLLRQKPYQQKDLAKAIAVSGAGLLYHLNILVHLNLIRKKTLMSVGNVSVNEISLDPNHVQEVRQILGRKQDKYTLITGLGKDSSLGEPYTIPNKMKQLLADEGYDIQRIVAFVTPDSSIEKAKQLVNIDRIIEAPYPDYRNLDSDVMVNLETVIQEEQKDNDIILDLTPLTKLLTMKLVEISHKYKIPSVYLGRTSKDEDKLLWMYYVPDKE